MAPFSRKQKSALKFFYERGMNIAVKSKRPRTEEGKEALRLIKKAVLSQGLTQSQVIVCFCEQVAQLSVYDGDHDIKPSLIYSTELDPLLEHK